MWGGLRQQHGWLKKNYEDISRAWNVFITLADFDVGRLSKREQKGEKVGVGFWGWGKGF